MLKNLLRWALGARTPEEAEVERVARQFLRDWAPFRDRYPEAGPLSVHRMKRGSPGAPGWIVNVTPAMDISCALTMDEARQQVTEARLVAMRVGAVLAEWRR